MNPGHPLGEDTACAPVPFINVVDGVPEVRCHHCGKCFDNIRDCGAHMRTQYHWQDPEAAPVLWNACPICEEPWTGPMARRRHELAAGLPEENAEEVDSALEVELITPEDEVRSEIMCAEAMREARPLSPSTPCIAIKFPKVRVVGACVGLCGPKELGATRAIFLSGSTFDFFSGVRLR